MSIESIKKYLRLVKDGDATLLQRFEIIKQQQRAIEEQFNEAKRRLEFIDRKVQWYQGKLDNR